MMSTSEVDYLRHEVALGNAKIQWLENRLNKVEAALSKLVALMDHASALEANAGERDTNQVTGHLTGQLRDSGIFLPPQNAAHSLHQTPDVPPSAEAALGRSNSRAQDDSPLPLPFVPPVAAAGSQSSVNIQQSPDCPPPLPPRPKPANATSAAPPSKSLPQHSKGPHASNSKSRSGHPKPAENDRHPVATFVGKLGLLTLGSVVAKEVFGDEIGDKVVEVGLELMQEKDDSPMSHRHTHRTGRKSESFCTLSPHPQPPLETFWNRMFRMRPALLRASDAALS
ncbi:hypothetical protein HDU93_005482 [Gonapodya sp. JEL0774]|nr:hypothetical protein HDU93_005482 [Gonapodya sp. JEL0774]